MTTITLHNYLKKIEDLGGVLPAIEQGYIQKEIQESAYRYQQQIENKENITTHLFNQKGNNIFVIGRSVDDLGSSEYLEFYHEISRQAADRLEYQASWH